MNLIDLQHVDQRSESTQTLQPRHVALTASLMILTVIAVSTSIGLVMLRAPTEASREATFARAMASHHAQAVEMALIIRDRSSDPELRQLALDIILTQQGQIGQMEGWLAAWGLPLGSPAQSTPGIMPGMAAQSDINALRIQPIPQAEASFLQLMIAHHQGGVQMAQEVLDQTNRREVVRLAQAIVQSQQNEINTMQSLLRTRGIDPTIPTIPPMNHGTR